MELFKQDMDLFLLLPGLWSKNFFYKMFLICSKDFKINFQNRKWNYPNRIWNYFSHIQAFNQKTSFTKCFSLVPGVSKLIFKTGKGIIQTGNGIISPTSRPRQPFWSPWPPFWILRPLVGQNPECSDQMTNIL